MSDSEEAYLTGMPLLKSGVQSEVQGLPDETEAWNQIKPVFAGGCSQDAEVIVWKRSS